MLLKTGAVALFATVAMAATTPAAQAATYLSVGPNSLCGAGGCFSASKTFTQTYSASGLVSGLNLDRSLLGENQNLAVKISFYDSAGNKVGDWGAFVVAGLSGQVVTLGGQSFKWDASQGDLTLRLDLVKPDKGAGGGGFAGSGFGGGGGGGGGLDDGGITGPGVGGDAPRGLGGLEGPPLGLPSPPPPDPPSVAAVVAEPASWALMIMGFGAAGALIRRERRHFRYG